MQRCVAVCTLVLLRPFMSYSNYGNSKSTYAIQFVWLFIEEENNGEWKKRKAVFFGISKTIYTNISGKFKFDHFDNWRIFMKK